jgi:hypothetical protein
MHSLDIHETCTNTDGEMIFNSDIVMQPDDVVLCVLSSDTATEHLLLIKMEDCIQHLSNVKRRM